MEDTFLTDKIKTIAEPLFHSLGVELYDIEFGGLQRGGLLRITIDKEGGVTLDDCAKASRHLSRALDLEEIITQRYTLEVSSPGLNRPLKKREHFVRVIGKRVKLKTFIPIGEQKVFVGRLSGFKGDKAFLQLDQGGEQQIPYDQIAQACLEIDT
ncbi:MAG: ribosome maturation factor RimP [Nitrospira sp.]|nr:ribosome maturation factor RimP [Candidatus Manganitrophaceae bacterium]HIL34226.1 ribosome maturation factor RimP [Candidatus Manganitrophaceae bacterium]